MLVSRRVLILAIAGIVVAAPGCGTVAGETPAPHASVTTRIPAPSRVPSAAVTPGKSPAPVHSPTPDPVRFAGYDLALAPGTFWRYRWTYQVTSCAQGSGCGTKNDDGEFVVTLGSPKAIQGVSMFPLQISGDSAVGIPKEDRDFAPRWSYLGVAGNRLVASDGAKVETLFDAASGEWAGGGYFTDRFESDELIAASAGVLDADSDFASWAGFRTGPVESVGHASSQGECETIEGRRICPRDTAVGLVEREYYRAGIGPLAYLYDYSFSFSGGGFSSSTSWKERLALVASSLRGDAPQPTPTPARDLSHGGTREVEPNDGPEQAQQLTLGVALSGDIQIGDESGGPEVQAVVGGESYLFAAEDHYAFELPAASGVRISLELDADLRDGVSVGLLLWDAGTGQPLAAEFDPGSVSLDISQSLPAGSYYVGVAGSETPRGRVTYSLRVDPTP